LKHLGLAAFPITMGASFLPAAFAMKANCCSLLCLFPPLQLHVLFSQLKSFQKCPTNITWKVPDIIIIIMVELTGEGRACIPVGLTKTWDGLVN